MSELVSDRSVHLFYSNVKVEMDGLNDHLMDSKLVLSLSLQFLYCVREWRHLLQRGGSPLRYFHSNPFTVPPLSKTIVGYGVFCTRKKGR